MEAWEPIGKPADVTSILNMKFLHNKALRQRK